MKRISSVVLLLSMCLCLSACGSSVANNIKSAEYISAYSVIGTMADTSSAEIASRYSDNVIVYDSQDVLVSDLKSGKLDCILSNEILAKSLKKGRSGIKIQDSFVDEQLCFAIAKENADLKIKRDSAIAAIDENGTLKDIIKGYTSGKGSTYTAQLDPEQTESKLVMAVRENYYPYSYVDGEGNLVGIDVDIAYAICDWLGVGLEIETVTDADLIELVWFGRVNFAAGGIWNNESDGEKISFSEPYAQIVEKLITRR